MRENLTPKQVARALDVSESSVKRWCDKGVIPTQYTAGGHRRILLPDLLEFCRTGKRELVRPDVVGLPATSGRGTRVIGRAAERLRDGLLAGDDELCRRIAVDLHLAEFNMATICDDVIARAFAEIGDQWECGEAEVFQERRGCEIALRVLYQLDALLPEPPPNAPLAIGAATAGDTYHLPTTMAELVLRDARWNAVSLGANLPFDTLAAAIQTHRPRIFWLSCSHLPDVSEFLSGYRRLYDALGTEVAIVVGGRALDESLRKKMQYAAYCDNMRHLDAFAQSLGSR